MITFDDLKEWAQSSWKAQASAREEMEDDYHFADGHQWTDSEKQMLEANSRVPVVFNRAMVIISSVAGSEINNRTEIRYIPREIGDVKPNEVLTAGAEWFRDQSDAEDSDSEAFQDALICGLGFTETALDFDEDPEGEPAVLRIDPLEMGYDHYSVKKGLSKARYIFRVKQMPAEEAEEMFPDYTLREIDAAWIDETTSGGLHINVPGDQYAYGDNDMDEEPNVVRVVQIQYRQKEKFVEYMDPLTGQKGEMEKETFEVLKERVPGIQHRTVNRTVWRQAVLGADEVLSENQPDPNGPTFHAITGYWDRKDKRFYGILRSMKDPQKYANKWLSQTMHIINSNAKGGIMAETDVTDKPRDLEDGWAASDSVTWLKPGSIASGKIQPKPSAQMPTALMSLTEFAISSIRDASGVNMELLGLRDANQPGVLEYQRRQSAMTTLARFFDSLRFYRKQQGQTILHFLRAHIAPTGRLVRIVKEDQVQYVKLAMADEVEKYDVIVDDAPSAPNEKEKAWAVISELMPLLMQSDMSMEDWADVLEYSPLPSSFADKVREKAKGQKNNGPTPQERLMEAELQAKLMEPQVKQMELQAKAQEIAEKNKLEAKKLQIEEAKLQLEASRPAEDKSIDVGRLQLDREKFYSDREIEEAKIELERAKILSDGEHRSEDRRLKANEGLVSAGLPPDYSFDDDRAQFAAVMEKMQNSDNAMAQLVATVADVQAKLGEGQQEIAEGLKDLANAEKVSKRVIRDSEGRVVGVEAVQ
ncbi:MAG: portal protein [Pseudomonadota bacterium]